MLHPCLPGAEMSRESTVQRLVSLLTGPLSFGKKFGLSDRFWFEFGLSGLYSFDHLCL